MATWGPIQLRLKGSRQVEFEGEASPAPGGGAMPQPDDIPNLALWLDASALVGLSDGDPVALWPDRSANGYDAAQGDVSLQPTYKANIQDGKPAVRFDEDAPEVVYLGLSGDGLSIARDIDGCTIFAVANYMGQRADARPFWASYAADSEQPRVVFGEAAFEADLAESGSSLTSSFPDFDGFDSSVTQTFLIGLGYSDWGISGAILSTFAGVRVLYGSSGWQEPSTTPDSDSAAVRIGYRLGSTPGLFLDLAELLVYTRALNSLERRQVTDYLTVKWATL